MTPEERQIQEIQSALRHAQAVRSILAHFGPVKHIKDSSIRADDIVAKGGFES